MSEWAKANGNERKVDRLTTLRMTLTPMRNDDVDAVASLLAQPGVRRFLCDDRVLARQDVVEIRDRSAMLHAQTGAGLWCMHEMSPVPSLIGIVGFLRFHEPPVDELIFAVDDGYRGHGLASEAIRAMLRYARDVLGWTLVQASTNQGNQASIRTLLRQGFVEVGILPADPAPLRLFRRSL